MSKEYLIDGNNLIGKIASLKKVQKSQPQHAREKLVMMLSRYFVQKRCSPVLFFDGFPKEAIASGEIKIIYSEKREADVLIKEYIDRSRNPKLLFIVSSDASILAYARTNACSLITSEHFSKFLQCDSPSMDNEESGHNLHTENDYFIKLFNKK